jgi:hypothetical protein
MENKRNILFSSLLPVVRPRFWIKKRPKRGRTQYFIKGTLLPIALSNISGIKLRAGNLIIKLIIYFCKNLILEKLQLVVCLAEPF